MTNEEILEDVLDSYNNIIRKIPYIDHLDTTLEPDGLMGWDIYYTPSTPYRYYLHIEIDDFTDKMNISVTVESDPDLMNHHDFASLTTHDRTFKIDNISTNDYQWEDSDVGTEVYKKLEQALEFQLDIVLKHPQEILKEMEKEIESGFNKRAIHGRHDWIALDWISIEELIELSLYNIGDIPLVLRMFGLDTNERFLTQEVKDIFIF